MKKENLNLHAEYFTARAYLELLQKDHTGIKLIKLCVFNALCNILE